jgi:uncharacterized membrane protein YeiH
VIEPASLPIWLEILAMTVAGALGAAIARSRHSPIYGTLFAGVVVGLGGGMVRDMLLTTRPVAIVDARLIPIVVAGAVVGALAADWVIESSQTVIALQGIALGLLVVIGSQRAIDFDVPMPAIVFLGLITATAGGIMLDAMTARQTAALAQSNYFATAAFLGAIVFWPLSVYVSFPLAAVVTVVLVATLRVISVRRDWKAPEWPRRARRVD